MCVCWRKREKKSVHLSNMRVNRFSINTHISTFSEDLVRALYLINDNRRKNNKQAVGIIGKVQFFSLSIYFFLLIILFADSSPFIAILSRLVPFWYFAIFLLYFFSTGFFNAVFFCWYKISVCHTHAQDIMWTILIWFLLCAGVNMVFLPDVLDSYFNFALYFKFSGFFYWNSFGISNEKGSKWQKVFDSTL